METNIQNQSSMVNDNMQELEALRQQVKTFKERMDQQQIVNDKLLRRSMKSQVSWIKHTNGWTSLIGLLLMPFFVLSFHYMLGMQWAPIVVLCLAIVFDFVFNMWQIRSISASMFATSDLMTVKRKMLSFKRREQLQMAIEVPLILIWLIWAFMTSESANGSNDFNAFIKGSGIIGGIIGILIVAVLYYFEIRTVNKTIAQLDEFTNDN